MINSMMDPIFDKYMEQLGYTKQCDNLSEYQNFSHIYTICIYRNKEDIIYIGLRKDNGNFMAYINGPYRIPAHNDNKELFYCGILLFLNSSISNKYFEEKHNERLQNKSKRISNE